MSRLLSLVALALLLPALVSAQVFVPGYLRRDGTYVQPHYRSAPDHTPDNNWSTRGNLNPYTGQYGTHTPQPQPYQPLPSWPYVQLPPPVQYPYGGYRR